MAQNRPAVLEVDENAFKDDDPADTESIGSASYVSSLTSGIKNYKYENGRRYHAFREGSYIVPNDDEEQGRMDLLHHIYLLITGGRLYLAPISHRPQRVLDIGTGTGIWALQFADEHPSTKVLGIDLSPIQPQWIPENLTFVVDDYETEWVYKDKFDFIHGRELCGCIEDHDRLFKRAFENLNSGGYFELQSVEAYFVSDDGTHQNAETCQMWLHNLREAGEKFGKTLYNVKEWKEKMEKAGFVDVKDELYKLPIGKWPKDPKMKEIGKYQQVQQIIAADSYTPRLFTQVLGWKKEEMDVMLQKVKTELKDSKLHMYLPVHFVYGRKP